MSLLYKNKLINCLKSSCTFTIVINITDAMENGKSQSQILDQKPQSQILDQKPQSQIIDQKPRSKILDQKPQSQIFDQNFYISNDSKNNNGPSLDSPSSNNKGQNKNNLINNTNHRHCFTSNGHSYSSKSYNGMQSIKRLPERQSSLDERYLETTDLDFKQKKELKTINR